jgi:hypothetical protein
MTVREAWAELYPKQPWPGLAAAVAELIDEVRSLRTLTDTIVTTCVDEQQRRRSLDEVIRAHDIVGTWCVNRNDHENFEHVSALCWVLRHDHNHAFADLLAEIEADLQRLGLHVVRMSEVFDPKQEQ